MFSLIITIVAIALVAALALATLYYGADIFSDGQSKAQSARYLQEGNQLVGAMELYKAEHGALPAGTPAELQAELIDKNYLSSWPGTEWNFSTDYAIRADITLETCQAINAKLKLPNPEVVPTCSEAPTTVSICCTGD